MKSETPARAGGPSSPARVKVWRIHTRAASARNQGFVLPAQLHQEFASNWLAGPGGSTLLASRGHDLWKEAGVPEEDDVRRLLDSARTKAQQQASAYAASSEKRVWAAAVHEAGHAVVGALSGERIGDIVLCPPAEGETEWGGHTVREPGSASLRQQVQAALAGDAAEGNQDYDRDKQKAMHVLGNNSVDASEVRGRLDEGWSGAQELLAKHRDAVDCLADLIRGDVAAGKHRHIAGEAVRAELGTRLDRAVEVPSGGDSEPCDCGHFPPPDAGTARSGG